MTTLALNNVSKSYDAENVLSDVNFEVADGEMIVIVGPSGCGKSSLLRMVAGLEPITAGEVLINGQVVNKVEPKDRDIAMVFQNYALYPHMTVEENIMFPMQMFTNKQDDEIRDRANEVIKRVNLVDANEKHPDEISGGMKKRVAIARAIVMNPKYLFCDEPNSGLDQKTAIIIDNLIQEITSEYNITTVINTHDMNSVMEIGEKIVFLLNGKKAWEGSKEDIFNTENEAVSNFVYSSDLFKKVREMYLKT